MECFGFGSVVTQNTTNSSANLLRFLAIIGILQSACRHRLKRVLTLGPVNKKGRAARVNGSAAS